VKKKNIQGYLIKTIYALKEQQKETERLLRKDKK
jgi:hypothetical protein